MRPVRLVVALLALSAGALAALAAALPAGEGARLYQAKCGKCHRPYPPSEIRAGEWERHFAKMRKRAHLTDEEAETIRRYVESNMPPPPSAATPRPG